MQQITDKCVTVELLYHLGAYHIYISFLFVFHNFILGSTHTTQSKKVPYVRLALGKRPKWHLGRFILHFTNLHQFSCVCPVIDHEFCHIIVKVAVDP